MPVSLAATPPAPKRGHIDRIGTRVLREMVEMVVTGSVAEGEPFPSERVLCVEFGVSRTVVRECVKRLQEKGLIAVAPARGAHVRDAADWNVLDPDVFDAMIRHDESLGVLDEVSVLRGALEGTMAGEVATSRTDAFVAELETHLHDMRDAVDDRAAFLEADMRFHLAVMTASRNRLASTIARSFFVRPRQSARWDGSNPADAAILTVQEHERIVAAIEAGDADAARAAMEDHILVSWRRRRFPDGDNHVTI